MIAYGEEGEGEVEGEVLLDGFGMGGEDIGFTTNGPEDLDQGFVNEEFATISGVDDVKAGNLHSGVAVGEWGDASGLADIGPGFINGELFGDDMVTGTQTFEEFNGNSQQSQEFVTTSDRKIALQYQDRYNGYVQTMNANAPQFSAQPSSTPPGHQGVPFDTYPNVPAARTISAPASLNHLHAPPPMQAPQRSLQHHGSPSPFRLPQFNVRQPNHGPMPPQPHPMAQHQVPPNPPMPMNRSNKWPMVPPGPPQPNRFGHLPPQQTQQYPLHYPQQVQQGHPQQFQQHLRQPPQQHMYYPPLQAHQQLQQRRALQPIQQPHHFPQQNSHFASYGVENQHHVAQPMYGNNNIPQQAPDVGDPAKKKRKATGDPDGPKKKKKKKTKEIKPIKRGQGWNIYGRSMWGGV